MFTIIALCDLLKFLSSIRMGFSFINLSTIEAVIASLTTNWNAPVASAMTHCESIIFLSKNANKLLMSCNYIFCVILYTLIKLPLVLSKISVLDVTAATSVVCFCHTVFDSCNNLSIYKIVFTSCSIYYIKVVYINFFIYLK